MAYTSVTAEAFAALDGLADWRYLFGALHGTFRAPSFPAGAELVAAVAAAAEAANHHPDVELRYPGRVHVALTTHETGGVTTADIELARAVSVLAAAAGATPEPTAAQVIELAIDTMDVDRVRPFWAAVLDYRVAADGSLFDPRRTGQPVWFQTMAEPRTERNRFHVDVSVPHDLAEARIAAALAAGGRLVSDRRARAFWVLADADGNEACICTWQDR